jgi:hypothetical protein
MKLSDVMSATGLSVYAELALLLFVGVFLGVALDLFFSKERNERMRLLPLEDEARSTVRPGSRRST